MLKMKEFQVLLQIKYYLRVSLQVKISGQKLVILLIFIIITDFLLSTIVRNQPTIIILFILVSVSKCFPNHVKNWECPEQGSVIKNYKGLIFKGSWLFRFLWGCNWRQLSNQWTNNHLNCSLFNLNLISTVFKKRKVINFLEDDICAINLREWAPCIPAQT